ncbi:MAG: type II toxin-antitoxin system prevent-host-death family antitoxin [Desulfobacterales bacterium]|nr:type II toxin-antitoxin system prevent-host-death family antitoxin [Desulfobacterales bacterium]
MNIVEIEDAKDSLRNYAQRVKDHPIVITDHGRPVAALLPLDNTDIETATLSTNPKFLALIERSRRRQTTEGGISSQEMRKRLGINA